MNKIHIFILLLFFLICASAGFSQHSTFAINYGIIDYGIKEPAFEFMKTYSNVTGIQYSFIIKEQLIGHLGVNYKQKNYKIINHGALDPFPSKITNKIGYLEIQGGLGVTGTVSNKFVLMGLFQFTRSGFINRLRKIESASGNNRDLKDPDSYETYTSMVDIGIALDFAYLFTEKVCAGIKPFINKQLFQKKNKYAYDIEITHNYGAKLFIGYLF